MWQFKRWAWIHGLGPVLIAEHYIINQALNSQKIPHIPGWRVSYGVSIVSISDGADAVTCTCIMRPWITANVWHTHIFKLSWCRYFRSCSVHWWAEKHCAPTIWDISRPMVIKKHKQMVIRKHKPMVIRKHKPMVIENINQWWLGNINQWLGNTKNGDWKHKPMVIRKQNKLWLGNINQWWLGNISQWWLET